MTTLSIRIPTTLDERLSREARAARVPRSTVVREALTDFVARKERERFMTEFVAAARALARSSGDSLSVAEELLPLENEALDLSERSARGTGAKAAPRRRERR